MLAHQKHPREKDDPFDLFLLEVIFVKKAKKRIVGGGGKQRPTIID